MFVLFVVRDFGSSRLIFTAVSKLRSLMVKF